MGEVSIGQEDLDDFLRVSEELQLKGLTGTEEKQHDEEIIINQFIKTKRNSVVQNNLSHANLDDYNNREIKTINEERYQISNTREIVATDVIKIKTAANIEQLDSTINSMIIKLDGIWTCTQCGKTDKSKCNLGKHVEAKHIEGVPHPCNKCGKFFRSRNTLNNHTSLYHKQS